MVRTPWLLLQVRRETREEAGIEVGAVHILGSQPWPMGAPAAPCRALHCSCIGQGKCPRKGCNGSL